MLPVVIFLVPGVIALAAGMVSCLMKRIAFWKVQVTMIAFIVLYYILFFAFIRVVGN
jgi:membrane protein implicated in regulation of membrane protease activity